MPTLLGVAVILLVVILVLSIYHMTMLARLAEGEKVVGTTAQKLLGGEVPSEEADASEALGARITEREAVSSSDMQTKAGKAEKIQTQQTKREAKSGTHERGEQGTAKPGD